MKFTTALATLLASVALGVYGQDSESFSISPITPSDEPSVSPLPSASVSDPIVSISIIPGDGTPSSASLSSATSRPISSATSRLVSSVTSRPISSVSISAPSQSATDEPGSAFTLVAGYEGVALGVIAGVAVALV